MSKAIETEDFKKLANITLYVLRLVISGGRTVIFKSKNEKKIMKKMDAFQEIFGDDTGMLDNSVEMETAEYDCKDTFDYDINHVNSGINCFRGRYLE